MKKISCQKCYKEQSVDDDIKKAFCRYCGELIDFSDNSFVIRCPQCNVKQSVFANLESYFCKYCGFQIKNIKLLQESNADSEDLLSCPSCAAPFKRILDDGNGRYAVCDYCGRKLFIDYYAQEAYEIEKAKIRAHENTQRGLLDALIEIEDAVLSINGKLHDQDTLVKKINDMNKQEDWLMRYRIVEMYVYPGLITFGNLFIASWFKSIIAYGVLAALSIGAFFYFTISSYVKSKKIAKEIESNERILLDVINDLNIFNEVLSKHKEITIPPDMLDKDSYDCVLGIIAEHNLDTLSEAVSIYRYWKNKQNVQKMKESIRRRQREKVVTAREVITTRSLGRDVAIGIATGVGVGLVARSIFKSLF